MTLQLIPLPPALLHVLSPETARFYEQTVPGYSARTLDTANAVSSLTGEPPSRTGHWLPISQAPHATRLYLMKGIAFTLFLFLFLNVFQHPYPIRWLLYAFVAGGTFQAFYGLIESLSGHQHIFAYQKKYYTDAATGTFINRNHFASFLELTLLVALGLLFTKLREPSQTTSWKDRLLALADRRASLSLVLLLSIGIVMIALVLSYSRAGIIFGLCAAGTYCLTELRREWSLKKTLLVATLGAVVLIPSYGVGYWKLTGRYAILNQEFFEPGGRLTVWEKTLEIFRDFPVMGTGVGTFQYVFPRYRSPSTTAFYDYAHNDYLQVLSETGILGAALMLWGIFLYVHLWVSRRSLGDTEGRVLHSSVGFALLALGLHEWVDFGLQIPANMVASMYLIACLVLLRISDTRSIAEARDA